MRVDVHTLARQSDLHPLARVGMICINCSSRELVLAHAKRNAMQAGSNLVLAESKVNTQLGLLVGEINLLGDTNNSGGVEAVLKEARSNSLAVADSDLTLDSSSRGVDVLEASDEVGGLELVELDLSSKLERWLDVVVDGEGQSTRAVGDSSTGESSILVLDTSFNLDVTESLVSDGLGGSNDGTTNGELVNSEGSGDNGLVLASVLCSEREGSSGVLDTELASLLALLAAEVALSVDDDAVVEGVELAGDLGLGVVADLSSKLTETLGLVGTLDLTGDLELLGELRSRESGVHDKILSLGLNRGLVDVVLGLPLLGEEVCGL